MDVDIRLNIIGLGVKRIFWERLSRLLQSFLSPDGIEIAFGYYNRKGLAGYKKYLEKLGILENVHRIEVVVDLEKTQLLLEGTSNGFLDKIFR